MNRIGCQDVSWVVHLMRKSWPWLRLMAGLALSLGAIAGHVGLFLIAALPGAFAFLQRSHDEHGRVLQPALSTP